MGVIFHPSALTSLSRRIQPTTRVMGGETHGQRSSPVSPTVISVGSGDVSPILGGGRLPATRRRGTVSGRGRRRFIEHGEAQPSPTRSVYRGRKRDIETRGRSGCRIKRAKVDGASHTPPELDLPSSASEASRLRAHGVISVWRKPGYPHGVDVVLPVSVSSGVSACSDSIRSPRSAPGHSVAIRGGGGTVSRSP